MRPSWKLSYVAAACVLAIAGCSGDGGSGTPEAADTTTAATRTTASTATTGTAAAGEAADITVDKTGWFGGFEITVDKATATPTGSTTDVELELSYKNLVGVKAPPPEEAYLDVQGSVIDVKFEEQTVAGFGEASGTATASVKASGSKADPEQLLDSAALVYGETDSNQTKIPFAEDGKVETIEPRGIPVGQTMGIGTAVTFQLTRAFLWPSYQPGEKGKYELWIEYNAECLDCPGVLSYAMHRDDFTLTAPDGKSVPADYRSPAGDKSVSSGYNVEGQWLVFLIDAPATGAYTLKITFVGTNRELKVEDTTTITL
ncbi:hypothetical protein [Rhodococcus daqingensis]|uniref:Lipoprotein n=1 Tax=Rhodococcus daqingensis TaxID=2479363 RepID=A0ABW2S1Q5_9NOCA